MKLITYVHTNPYIPLFTVLVKVVNLSQIPQVMVNDMYMMIASPDVEKYGLGSHVCQHFLLY